MIDPVKIINKPHLNEEQVRILGGRRVGGPNICTSPGCGESFRKKKLYVTFMDSEKVYEKVNRKGLEEDLIDVHGRKANAVKGFNGSSACVRVIYILHQPPGRLSPNRLKHLYYHSFFLLRIIDDRRVK